MGNIFTQDPLILDTAWGETLSPPSGQPAALANVPNQSFRLIVWEDPTTAGDTVAIVDQNGNVILEGFCAVAKQAVVLWDAGQTRRTLNLKQGLWALHQISSGKLLMYR